MPSGLTDMGKKSLLKVSTAALAMVLLYIMVNKTDRISNHQGVADFSAKELGMQERASRMRKTCSQYPIRRHLTSNLHGRLFYISEKHSLSYCRVAKVGSTFWTQVFMTLAGVKQSKTGEDNESLFDVPRDETHMEMKKHKDLTMAFSDKRVHSTLSFLVARNPYSRLFSSYIDQIYLPNKWKEAATMVTGKRRECGSDVSFDEFLNTISTRMLQSKAMDLHWAPIFSICLPCSSNIKLLAKQETFKDDAEFILSVAGVQTSILDEVNRAIGENIIENSLSTLVHTYVSKGHHVRKGCISEQDLAARIWSAFQIQGYIHNDIAFPAGRFTDISSSSMEETLLTEVLDAVKERKLSKEERNAQRQAWKVHFWKQISQDTLRKVQDAYYEDFYVFNYDINPETM